MQNEIWHVTFHDCSGFCSTTHPVWNILFWGLGWREEEQEDMPTVLSRFNAPPMGIICRACVEAGSSGKVKSSGSLEAGITSSLWLVQRAHSCPCSSVIYSPTSSHPLETVSLWQGRVLPYSPSTALNTYWPITLMEVIIRYFTYIV